MTLNTFRADGSSPNIKEKPEVLSFPVLKYQVESGVKIFACMYSIVCATGIIQICSKAFRNIFSQFKIILI